MATGQILKGMTPSEEEYRQVQDNDTDIRVFLQFVFKRDGKGETFIHSIEQVNLTMPEMF